MSIFYLFKSLQALIALMIVFLISSFFIGGPGIRNYPVIFRPHPVSINLDPELVERLQDVKRNFHRRFWDKRNSVLKFCSTNQTEHLEKAIREIHFNFARWRNSLWYDLTHGIIWCCNNKVASSTMVNHFLNLAGFVGKQFFQALKDRGVEVKNRRAEANKMFSLPEGATLTDAFMLLPSVAYIRHPFSRLASGYLERIVLENKVNGKNSSYAWLSQLVIERQRQDGSDSSPIPTPAEFFRYLIDEAKGNRTHYLDAHFIPQSFSCPFCSFEFDLIADITNFDNDFAFMADQLNIVDKVNMSRRDNDRKLGQTDDDRVKDVFSKVPKSMITDLYNQVFKVDFDMFGFPFPDDYIQMGHD